MKRVQLPSLEAVRAAVATSLESGASLPCIANRLGISARSLQRYLAAAGSSFSEIVADVRLATARRLLAETDDDLARIALRLGYSGPSSFSRAFMHLMNVQPAKYRRASRCAGARRSLPQA